jgi:protein SCO1/2
MKRLIPVFILSSILASGLWYLSQETPEIPSPKPLVTLHSATVLTPSQSIGTFSLMDANEKPFTEESLKGHWTLLFFGYATCPAVCPTTLSIISTTWKNLPASSLRFVFVSLDPETDTPKVLRSFLSRFNTNFMGLTGDEAVIETFSKACGIYYWEDTAAKSPVKQIDHSATLLLFNPAGKLHALFTPPHQPEALAKDLITLMSAE